MAPALLLASLLAAVAVADRVTVDLSYGVRFRVGPSAGTQCNTSTFPINLDNRQVNGLTQANGVTNAGSCLQAACAMGADLWQVSAIDQSRSPPRLWTRARSRAPPSPQFCVGGGAACGAVSCWVGSWPGSSNNQAGWQSGMRNASVPLPSPPESKTAFDDSAWSVLDLPHDYEVTGVFSQGGNGGEGYLPYNVSFYR